MTATAVARPADRRSSADHRWLEIPSVIARPHPGDRVIDVVGPTVKARGVSA